METRDNGTARTFECPGQSNCSAHPGTVSFTIGLAPSYVSLASATFSCLGSLLLALAFLTLPEIRTTAQKLITALSVADFFTAFGYFMAGLNFLTHYDPNPTAERRCKVFHVACIIQSFVTTTSSLSSFIWTLMLALYFHVVIVNKQTVFSNKAFALCNLIAWGAPLLITLPLGIKGFLGYSPYAASNWCYIKDTNVELPLRKKVNIILLIFVAGKFWEIIFFLIVTALYISIAISIRRTRRILQTSDSQMDHVEKRLLAIPLVFILLRVWGTAQFFYSLSISGAAGGRCIPTEKQNMFLAFGILQAIGDGGQGWSNAFLYIFLSPTIRSWFILDNLHFCYLRLRKCHQLINEEVSSRNLSDHTPHNRVGEDTTIMSDHERGEIGVDVSVKYGATHNLPNVSSGMN